jgi:hypothetical protein
MTTSLIKRQVYIDASALKESACLRHLWWDAVIGYTPTGSKQKEYKMAYGSGIHKFLENYYLLKPSVKDCIQSGVDYYQPWNDELNITNWEFRTGNNMFKTCKAYAVRYPRRKEQETLFLATDDFHPLVDPTGKPYVEYKFALPIYSGKDYDLILCGTIDLICSYDGESPLLVDHKTTANKVEEAQYFFRQFDFNIQTMLYSKVWKETHGLDYYPKVLINGIFLKKPTKKAEDAGIFDGVEILRSHVIEYTNEEMDNFDKWFDGKLETIISYLDSGEEVPFDMSCCGPKFSKMCQYYEVCKLPKSFQQGRLDCDFEIQQYNPLAFRD